MVPKRQEELKRLAHLIRLIRGLKETSTEVSAKDIAHVKKQLTQEQKDFLHKLNRLNRTARQNHATGAIDYVREHAYTVSSDNCVVYNPSPWRSIDEI